VNSGILTESPWLRLPIVLAVVLMFQTTLLAEVRPIGASVDLALLLAVAAGCVAGPVRGARAGLVIGFFLDLLLTKPIPFGLSALVFALTGFATGMVPDAVYDGKWIMRPLVVAVASGLSAILYAMAATVFGVPDLSLVHVTAVVLVGVISGLLLAPLLVRVMFWVLMAGDRPRA
jgi:rod shape-determining protein MreD